MSSLFETIVDLHGPAVLRLCLASLSKEEAEDAWSDTFMALLRVFPDIDPQTNFEAWLIAVAKNKVIDRQRSAARAAVATGEIVDQAVTDSVGSEDGLWSALRSLPDKQREAIAYHYVIGLPYSEVAVKSGNSEAAARRAAADGMRTLRKIYEESHD